MSNGNIDKKDLFNVIKHGHAWHAQKIKDELEKLIVMNPVNNNHSFSFDTDDKYHFIYDNECYLFVFDGRIEVRCDRENVFSSDKTFTHPIGEAKDILNAYEQFNSITMENDED